MRTSRALLGIVAGMVTGAIVGLLLAPDSGKNTRHKIVTRTNGKVDELKSRLNTLVDGFANHKEEMVMSKNNKADTARKFES